MLEQTDLLLCFALPAVASVVAALILRATTDAKWFEPAVVVGFLAGNIAHSAWNTHAASGLETAGANWLAAVGHTVAQVWAPHVARDWVPFSLVISLIVLLVASEPSPSKLARWLIEFVWFAIAALLAFRLLWGSVYTEQEWSESATAWRVLGLGFAMWLPGQICAIETDQRPRIKWLGLLAIAVTAGAIGMTLLLSGSQTYGLQGWIACAAITGAGLVEILAKSTGASNPRGIPLLLGSLLVLGLYFAELAPIHATLLFAAVIVSALQLRVPSTFDSPRQLALGGLLAIGLCTATVAMAGSQFAKDAKSAPANPYQQYESEAAASEAESSP